MFDSSDLPEDPNEVWASVTVAVDTEHGETHTHSDGSEHQMYAATMRIENHGLPSEKFVEALLMSCVTILESQMADNIFAEGVPDEVRAHMTKIMAKEYLKQKINTGEFPDSTLAFAIPTHVDFED